MNTENIDPVVSKVSGASGTITSGSTSFEWSGYDSDGYISYYEYQKDSGSWVNCGMNTSYTWSGYSEAAHTFRVRATDNDSGVSDIIEWSFTYSVPTVNHTLSVSTSPTDGGDVQIDSEGWGDSDSRNVAYDTSITIQAAEETGYIFAGWYNGLTKYSSANPYTFNLTEDLNLTAVFYTSMEEGLFIRGAGGFVNYTDQALLGSRVKFDRGEGAIGHTEVIIDFLDTIDVSRGDTLKITTKFGYELFFTVEKINTSDQKRIRVVGKDKIYFQKDKPLPAVVFVDVKLSEIFSWVATNGGFSGYDITPFNASDPDVPFYYIEEGTKLGKVLEEIAEAIQGTIFSAVTHEASEGNRLVFNVACLKPFNNMALMSLTADQLESDEISDLPRQHNQFTLKFKKKTQIPDTLVFRGASLDDTFDVPAAGYPEDSEDSYYAEFANPVISITDHSFDGYNCYIDQATWQSNFEESGVNYGLLSDPFKFKLRFEADDSYGGTIYDFRMYGNAIKEDEMTETLDVSGTDYAKEKEYQNDLISTNLNWHKYFLTWVTSRTCEERKITVVDPNVNFVTLMTLFYGGFGNQDNRVIDIDGKKMTVENATWSIAKEKWELSGRKTRTSTAYSGYIEVQGANGIFDDTQKRFVDAIEITLPNQSGSIVQLVSFTPLLKNYTVEIEPVYFKTVETDAEGNVVSGTVNYFVQNQTEGAFEFVAYSEAEDLSYFFDRWIDAVSEDVYSLFQTVYPNDPYWVEPTGGEQLKSIIFEVKDNNNLSWGTFVYNTDPVDGITARYHWSYFGVSEGGPKYELYVDIYNLSGSKIKTIRKIYDKPITAPNPYHFYMRKVVLAGTSVSPLEGQFRLKIFQDINAKRQQGIQAEASTHRSAVPVSYSVITSDSPSLTETYTTGSSERWAKVTGKNDQGEDVSSEIISVPTNSVIDLVCYKKTSWDGYVYFKYETDQVRELKFPHRQITSFSVVEVIL